MNIGIVTVYHPATNFGSYLQAYALKCFFEAEGHEVCIITNTSPLKITIDTCFKRINPKREFFLRIKKGLLSFKDIKKLHVKNFKDNPIGGFDLLVYGSDEIWNLEKDFFRDLFYWGGTAGSTPIIAYATSVGSMPSKFLLNSPLHKQAIKGFREVLVRDEPTQNALKDSTGVVFPLVCDPTMLVTKGHFTQHFRKPSSRYLLVYTYGIEKPMVDMIRRFAKENQLQIFSACFWHQWVDKVIECSALQFSSLIEQADYVFTTTFHGAIFSMLNHKKCCILPIRDKVRNVVTLMGEEKHLIGDDITYKGFCDKMDAQFDTDEFEARLSSIRESSIILLNKATTI